MGLSANINEKANLIWAIADKLTGVYKPHEYGEVILPLTVIRRLRSVSLICSAVRRSSSIGARMRLASIQAARHSPSQAISAAIP